MTIRTVAVLGAGTMGHGIAHAAMTAGYETRLYDVGDAPLSAARAKIDGIFKKSVELGKATAPDADAAMKRLSTSTSVAEVVTGCDLVIEAAPERIDVKLSLMAEVDRHAPAGAIIATNT